MVGNEALAAVHIDGCNSNYTWSNNVSGGRSLHRPASHRPKLRLVAIANTAGFFGQRLAKQEVKGFILDKF